MGPKRDTCKRIKKQPPRLKDSEVTLYTNGCDKWCTVLSIEDRKTHILHAKTLETETADSVSDSDLKTGNQLIWRYRGVPYTVELQAIHDENPNLKVTTKNGKQYPEDSSSDEQESGIHSEQLDEEPPPAKKVCKSKKRAVIVHDSSSDEESEHGVVTPNTKSPSLPSSKSSASLGSLADNMIVNKTPTRPQQKEPQASTQHLLHKLMKRFDGLEKKFDHKFKKLECILTTESTKEGVHQNGQVESASLSNGEPSDNKFISNKGVDLLTLRACNPEKYSLALMDAIFEDKEMSTSCFKVSKRSTKPPLPVEGTKLIEECIDHKFGKGAFAHNAGAIIRKCNQKCLDANRRMNKGGVKEEALKPKPEAKEEAAKKDTDD